MKRQITLFLGGIFLFIKPLIAVDFTNLQIYLEDNSKEIKLKEYDINISKKDLNIIKSESYPSINVGFNIENSKSLNTNTLNTSVGENSLVTDTLKKSYSYLSINYNFYSFGRLYSKTKVQEYKIESLKHEYCQHKIFLMIKLLDTYSNALSYQVKVKSFENIIIEKNKIYELQNRLFNIGNITKVEVTKSAIEVADMYSQINDNRKELNNLYEHIELLTNYIFAEKEKLEYLTISKLESGMEG